jgi:uncharacterized membrane protein YesL
VISSAPDRQKGHTCLNRSQGVILERVFKKSFWNIYDHIGLLVGINVLSIASSCLILPIPFCLFFLLEIVITFSNYQEVNLASSLKKAWKNYTRCLLLILFYIFLGIFFSFNSYFYISLKGKLSFVGILLSGFMLWILLACFMSVLFSFPLLVRGERKYRVILKKSFLLLLDNFISSGLISFFILVLTAVLIISGIGFLLLGLSIPSMIAATYYREVMKKYREDQEDDTWEEKRGFQDLFRPWQNT